MQSVNVNVEININFNRKERTAMANKKRTIPMTVFSLRLPTSLYEALKEIAKQESISVNTLILKILGNNAA